MPKKYYKNSIIILGLLALLAANFAYAEGPSLGDQTRNQSGFIYSLAHAAGKAVYLAGQVTTWALNLNSRIIKGNPTLTAGWTISRDLANLGFVLVIILIAFATILRIETYGMKQILWKLIVAALLINFSLVIAGVFIDFAGVVTNFFLLQSVDSPNKVAQVLADGLSLQKFVGRPPVYDESSGILGTIGNLLSFGPALLEISTTLLFILAFTVIGALTMAVFAGMLFIRYIVLSILLILMPLAWLFWIIPDLSGNWKKWWDEFFKWTFFAPAVSFFVFLAINAKSSNIGGEIMTSSIGYASVGDLLSGLGEAMGQLFMTMGLLIGGMIAAQSMGIAGAQIVTSRAKALGQSLALSAGGAGAGMLGLRTKFVQDRLKKMEEFGKGKGVANWVARTATTPFRAVAGGARAAGLAFEEPASVLNAVMTGSAGETNLATRYQSAAKKEAEKNERTKKAKALLLKRKAESQKRKDARKTATDESSKAQKLASDAKIAFQSGDIKRGEMLLDESTEVMQKAKEAESKGKRAPNLGLELERDSAGNVVIDPATGKPKMKIKDIPEVETMKTRIKDAVATIREARGEAAAIKAQAKQQKASGGTPPPQPSPPPKPAIPTPPSPLPGSFGPPPPVPQPGGGFTPPPTP